MTITGPNNFSSLSAYAKAVARFGDARRCLAFGDSWFQYPPRAIDLEKRIAKAFRGTLFLDEAVAGRDSTKWKIGLPRIEHEIAAFGFDAILLSIGGNDIVGKKLGDYLKTRESPQPEPVASRSDVPDGVFDHVRIGPLERALDVVVADLAEIVRYRDASSPDSIVFAHTYDYIWPDGAPFRLGPVVVGPWAKPALDAVGLLDPEAQRIVTGWLLDRFADALHAFASANANVRIIDSRGTLTSKSQWDNEIHPTAAGFARIARECWIPALSDLLE